MYSCGPTVYDNAHIGNLSAYIFADTLRRALEASGYSVKHVMNYTDIDDKTIRRSRERYPLVDPLEALKKLTKNYIDLFLADMRAIGNNVDAIIFLKATGHIKTMQDIICKLYADGFAYSADDGVYFSIEAYKKSGKTYGQLLSLSSDNTGKSRIENDEYDKESVHDFALWKAVKDGEPAWDFTLGGQTLRGRPGWHIECSAMSQTALGLPFDIHTGGVDLIFPHHENEIAQSTAGRADPRMAQFFTHNEHIVVDGRKMAKSANNFYTLLDVHKKGYDPLAFRLMILQSHYRSQVNFSWDNLQAAANRLGELRAMAELRWQVRENVQQITYYDTYTKKILEHMQDDLNTPLALATLSGVSQDINEAVGSNNYDEFLELLKTIDDLFGLGLLTSSDIDDQLKAIIQERQRARNANDWPTSDKLRANLEQQGIGVRDTPSGQIWHRL